MRRTPNRPGPRAGFTLVELLVVITIIAILFALTSAAVVKALGKGDESRVRNDISQMAAGIQGFKTHYAVPFMTDAIILKNDLTSYNLTNAAEAESLRYLKSVWPRLGSSKTDPSKPNSPNNPPAGFISWDGTMNSNTNTLSGPQCLVFFLGGPKDPNSSARIGFSTNPTNPMGTNTTNAADVLHTSRVNTFFDFPPDRLTAGAFPTFTDIFGTQPYLYFSSRLSGNDYSNQYPLPPLAAVVKPYQTSATRFANPNGFQIISAGKNGVFNSGGLSWPGGGGSTTADGYYNIANFHPTLLGIAAQ